VLRLGDMSTVVSLTCNAWYNTTSRVVYPKSRDKNFAFLKILKFGCIRTGIFYRFWNSGCFSTHLGLFLNQEKIYKIWLVLSEKLDPENAYEPHIDIYYKSLLFWQGSVPIKVTNFQPPVKTLVRNSCLKLNSILYKSQNREANEGSVHCADIEGIDVKLGSANSFGCRTLCKTPDISPSPKQVALVSSHYLTNTWAIGLTPITDITFI